MENSASSYSAIKTTTHTDMCIQFNQLDNHLYWPIHEICWLNNHPSCVWAELVITVA